MDQVRDLVTKLERIENKLDALTMALAADRQSLAVHAAVCDTDRKDLRREYDTAKNRLWKLLVAAVGAGTGGAALLEGILKVTK